MSQEDFDSYVRNKISAVLSEYNGCTLTPEVIKELRDKLFQAMVEG